MTEEMTFEFDLVCALPEGTDEGAILDALYEAGCNDAVVGLGAAGLIGLGFTRAGQDAETVIFETVEQVMTGLPEGTKLREVKPDLVSLADVAARLKVTRQALQKRKMPPPSLGGGGVVQSIGDAPVSGRRPGEAERGFSRCSGMVRRRPRRTKGKRQDQSHGVRA